jgi:hypothetical protein
MRRISPSKLLLFDATAGYKQQVNSGKCGCWRGRLLLRLFHVLWRCILCVLLCGRAHCNTHKHFVKAVERARRRGPRTSSGCVAGSCLSLSARYTVGLVQLILFWCLTLCGIRGVFGRGEAMVQGLLRGATQTPTRPMNSHGIVVPVPNGLATPLNALHHTPPLTALLLHIPAYPVTALPRSRPRSLSRSVALALSHPG